MEELRWLLFAPAQQQIEALRHRLDDPQQKAEELSESVVEALAIRSQRDGKLQATLQIFLEDALKVEAARDPRSLVASLAPVFGLALFKAGLRFLRRKLAWLNYFLGSALSLESLRWRFTSWRSGHPFNAVALTSSRRYRVEQAFVIHRTTGRLLGQAGGSPERENQVLATIEALGHTGMRNDLDEKQPHLPKTQDVLEIGERTMWLRHGPLVSLAVIVNGHPPTGLGQQLETENEIIHELFGPELRTWDGDPELVSAMNSHLRGCLMLGRRKIGTRTSYNLVWAAAMIFAIVCIALASWRIRDDRRWARYIDHLRGEPGIAVLETHRGWASYSVSGLRDPLSADPAAELADCGIPKADVAEHWEPYMSLDPRIEAERARPAADGATQTVQGRRTPE
jgi:hypothetical protein